MAKPIKETPVLRGKDAMRFLRDIASNEKRDHSASFARAQVAYNHLQAFMPPSAHVQTFPK